MLIFSPINQMFVMNGLVVPWICISVVHYRGHRVIFGNDGASSYSIVDLLVLCSSGTARLGSVVYLRSASIDEIHAVLHTK